MSIKATQRWFKAAVPEPTIKTLSVQIGCDIEEMAEGLAATQEYACSETLNQLGNFYKQNIVYGGEIITGLLNDEARLIDFVDAQLDKIVTSVGVLHMLGLDAEELLTRVNDSNFSKFEDGKPVFDENGKIKKGKHYEKVDLSDIPSKVKLKA